jgi:uncharacterized protein
LRRKDKEIGDRDLIDGIIRKCQVCRVALARDGVPYIVPVSFGYDGSALYFHTALSGQKLDFIEANPRVCFEFEHDVRLVSHESDPCNWTFSYQSVIGSGTVRELVDQTEKGEGLLEVMRQYSPAQWIFTPESLHAVRLWKIDIETISGKQSRDRF